MEISEYTFEEIMIELKKDIPFVNTPDRLMQAMEIVNKIAALRQELEQKNKELDSLFFVNEHHQSFFKR